MTQPGDPAYWIGRWSRGETGWHEAAGNTLLHRHWEALALAPGSRVLVPFAGASPDLAWLAGRGHRVCAVDVSETAAVRFFERLGQTPGRTKMPIGELWEAERIEFWVADLFDLGPEQTGRIDGIYDRAALVSLPRPERRRYAAQVLALAPRSEQLLIVFEYPQGAIPGPPFSVGPDEVRSLYGEHCEIRELESLARPGSPLVEHAYWVGQKGRDG